MKKEKKWIRASVWLFVALMFFSPFAAFLQGGGGNGIYINLEVRENSFTASQSQKIAIAKDSNVRSALESHLSLEYSNESSQVIECVNDKCGSWQVYQNSVPVAYLDREVESGDKIIVVFT